MKDPALNNTNCSGMLKDDFMQNKFETECKGKSSCQITTLNDQNQLLDEMTSKDNSILYDPTDYFNQCVDDRSAFYVQYSCEAPVQET